MASSTELLRELLGEVEGLSNRNDTALDAVRRKAEMYIRNIFGETSKYLTDLEKIGFHPMVYPADEEYLQSSWSGGIGELKNLIQTMLTEVKIFGSEKPDEKIGEAKAQSLNMQAFVVHGHDDVSKLKVARFLERLDVKPIILHEQANGGRTIIEKFEETSSVVDFAIVILSGDDVGSRRDESNPPRKRARQNVIFELGYFVGLLGRSRVVALREVDVELPSDYSGVIYIDLDDGDAWRLNVAREMKSAGMVIDMNKAL
ncbi:nucleotide-binding protein [Amycolatopsis sp. NPDC051102]|uniref:nucleotide-binding protein n=1 Tax=Amycolatopsis sp. NPDC051102 TaxID=3155163 RepID=UPI0034164D4D